MHHVKFCTTEEELRRIIDLRYEVLRKPWHQSRDSAGDTEDANSVNAYIENLEGKIIACGRLQVNAGNKGQIRYMAVDENHRGLHLGLVLLRALEAQAAQLQLSELELQARENAVGFYENAGYAIVAPSFKLWGVIQHFLMHKKLHAD